MRIVYNDCKSNFKEHLERDHSSTIHIDLLLEFINLKMVSLLFTAQKVSVFGVILVHIFPTFSCIRTEYREILRILRISLYSVQMREIAGKMQTRVTLNTGTFYAVVIINDFFQFGRNFVYELSSGNYFQRSNIQTIHFANKSVKY